MSSASERGVAQLLAGELSAYSADDDVKTAFLETVINDASFAGRLEEAVRRDPALTDLTNAEGNRAIVPSISPV